MAKLTIKGNEKPIVGETETYSLSVFDNLMTSNSFSFPPLRIEWNIHVQDRKGWRMTNGNTKEGERITYKFTNKSLKYRALKIEVVRGKDRGEFHIKPQEAIAPKIISVDVLDVNSQRLPKGKLLHYTDAIIAKAHCVGMLGHKVSFTLWEDDAMGGGHDPIINMMNKINPIPLVGEVDGEGVAKVIFRLPNYTMAVQIANAGVARGERNEGKTHEYYVTAEMISKHIITASPNVNVANPTHAPGQPKKPQSIDVRPPHRKPSTIPENKGTKPSKPKPKEETAKFPQTPAAKKQADPEGKILSAEFTDATGKSLKKAKIGDMVAIKIKAQNMKGKNVKVRIWEEDFSRYSNDLLYEETVKLRYDAENVINNIKLTNEMYSKSYEWGEGDEREYFIEVEHLNTSVTSQVIPISPNAEPVKVEADDSPSVIKEKKMEKIGCGGKFCIDKNSSPSELIREINIRLAGFGGNVPTDRFTDRTEKMIRQFQRDYMKVPETGKVCGNVLQAIDEFCKKWAENIFDYKCLCHASDSKVKRENRCPGYGKGERNEYPGLHRILLWGVSTLKFYLSQQNSYQYRRISAGYRCWAHNRSIPRFSTNHMGKAVDIQFNEDKYEISGKVKKNLMPLGQIRDKFYVKYLKAEEGWSIPSKKNNYRLEPIGLGKDESYSWIHMDVSLFEPEYLKDIFFTKEQGAVMGKPIIDLANELGYKNTCSCTVAESKQANVDSKCETCRILDKPRIKFYEEFGNAAIKMVDGKRKSNKFKGLYMVAQRRQENSFELKVPNNNPMNVKGKGDLGSSSLNTHEYINGKKVYMKDGFANFSSVEKGFEGYLDVLNRNFNEAYDSILDDSKTIDDFLIGMQDQGRLGAYATDPNYKALIKSIFIGVVKDYKKWLNCKLNCTSHSSEIEKIKADIELLEKLR